MTTKKKRTAADVIRDRVTGPSTMRQRIDYLNMPEVRRSMAIEQAEKKEPIKDVSKFPAIRRGEKSKPN